MNANKGVIFTGVGYEEGAIKYAKSKNIDIFIIRDLNNDEWSKPGRYFLLYLQIFSAQAQNIKTTNPRFLSLDGQAPKTPLQIKLELPGKNGESSIEKYKLYALDGTNKTIDFFTIFTKAQEAVLKEFVECFNELIEPENENHERGFSRQIIIKLSAMPYRFLMHENGYGTFDEITFDLLIGVTQSKIFKDFAENLDFALIVEDYISKQKYYVTKRTGDDQIKISDPIVEKQASDKPFINGSILKVTTEYSVGVNLKPETQITLINEPFFVNILEQKVQ